MPQDDPAPEPRKVEPLAYAGIATPREGLDSIQGSRAIFVGGILLRLIGVYTLVECRQPMTRLLETAYADFQVGFDLDVAWRFLVVSAYVAWGLLLVIRGPRFIAAALRRAPNISATERAEWSAAILSAAGAIVILWTMEPLHGVLAGRWVLGDFVPILGQLALGIWLFRASGRLSSVRSPLDRR